MEPIYSVSGEIRRATENICANISALRQVIEECMTPYHLESVAAPTTNRDRCRSMTPEQIVETLKNEVKMQHQYCITASKGQKPGVVCVTCNCYERLLEWLKAEAKE